MVLVIDASIYVICDVCCTFFDVFVHHANEKVIYFYVSSEKKVEISDILTTP